MTRNKYEFEYEEYDSIDELTEEDAWLLNEAREVTVQAYAPYSNFHVGAVAKLTNGEILAGSNQENASFPVGLCAERVLLASISSLFPNIPVETIAISYRSSLVESDHPISPCGICRQSLQEYEDRMKHPIRLILGGMTGKVYIIPRASMLLPLSFTGGDLGGF
ncbi:cytidine deaminase [Flavihumibacter stibioxidans]|uniref:Cytidine deaminase n=1 Tax=Flavihumibacter stibioxidans TaxID=1834163 RepID=A0ABR7M359_9BACT|nr:cytidine deaminase [Flavihumibacter stibioxidans]MBC6489407.1 cytidine deaminase [Flavihumibacter stibioxidans]